MFLIAHNYRHVLQAERSLQHAGITATKKKTLPLQYFTAMFLISNLYCKIKAPLS